MLRKIIPSILTLLLGAALTAGLMLWLTPEPPRPAMDVVGDVRSVYRVERPQTLAEAVWAAQPWEDVYSVRIIGADGFAAQLDGWDLDGCGIAYTPENGWYIDDDLHPPSTEVKHIDRIVVIGDLVDAAPYNERPGRVALVSAQERVYTSVGNLLVMDAQDLAVWQGRSSKGEHAVTVYTALRAVPVAGLFPGSRYLAMGRGGERMEVGPDVLLYVAGQRVDLYSANGKRVMEDVAGLYADPPELSNLDVYADALEGLSQGERVLVVELDGLGYDAALQYQALGALSIVGDMAQALSVYPPISPAGLAAMLTGVPGDQNGIIDRELKDLKRPDLFEQAAAHGFTCAYIEGDTTLVNTSLTPKLCPDQNGDGTDDEVFATALEALTAKPDLTFVHFHGIDDMLHVYGQDAQETANKVHQIDGYLQRLIADFDGLVIITSDHGHHAVSGENGPSAHGSFCREDLLIPYVRITKKG